MCEYLRILLEEWALWCYITCQFGRNIFSITGGFINHATED